MALTTHTLRHSAPSPTHSLIMYKLLFRSIPPAPLRLLAGWWLVLPCAAQMQADDILVSSWWSSTLTHFRPDGTEVLQSAPADRDNWRGALLLQDGNWAVTTESPAPWLLIYDSVTGDLISERNLSASMANTGDLEQFADGTLAIVDQVAGTVVLHDLVGNHVGTITHPSMQYPFGCFVDHLDRLWVGDVAGRVFAFDRQGSPLVDFATNGSPRDLLVAHDGTIWINSEIAMGLSLVEHWTASGAYLGGFNHTDTDGGGIGVASDGSLWISRLVPPTGSSSVPTGALDHYDQQGNLLGSFPTPHSVGAITVAEPPGAIGTSYCSPGASNSTGRSGAMSARGSTSVAHDNLTLVASDLPNSVAGFFLTSTMQGLVMNPAGSQGHLCLAGGIGRYVGAAQVQNTGSTGHIALPLELTQTPTPLGLVPVQPGETWNFQAWYRDANPMPTSNFTDAVAVTFH